MESYHIIAKICLVLLRWLCVGDIFSALVRKGGRCVPVPMQVLALPSFDLRGDAARKGGFREGSCEDPVEVLCQKPWTCDSVPSEKTNSRLEVAHERARCHVFERCIFVRWSVASSALVSHFQSTMSPC